MSENQLLKLWCYVVFFAKISDCFMIDRILHQEDTSDVDFIDLYIPTVYSENQKCRNHSLYYLEQLKNYTLWASEMFDASTKFPSGILYGSAYDFGNFDECLEVKVPYEDEQFSGQYCMAKFTVRSTFDGSILDGKYDYHFEDYRSHHNISAWKKVHDFLLDESKNSRDEVYFAYCLPSSCSNQELQLALEKVLRKVNNGQAYRVNVDVSKHTCQIAETVTLDTSDISFILVMLVSIGIVVLASIYDIYSKRDDYQHIRLSDKQHELALCFSFPRNFKKLMTIKSNPDGLNCLSGIKVYSMFLSISLHRNMFDYGVALDNPKFVEKFYSNPGMTYVLNGPIMVDTFFTISGFLSAYLILTQCFKGKNGINLVLLYLHRYIRMTSTYCIVIFFYCTVFAKMGSGPLWKERLTLEREKCRHIWWANLLYINNYVGTEYYCMFQSWYMACDMNSFIFIPLFCWLIWKKARLGLYVLVAAIMAAAITVFTVVFINDEKPILLIYLRMLLSPSTDSTFLKIYIPGHMRLTSYFIGALAGYLKYGMKKNNTKIPKMWVRLGWIFCVFLMSAVLQVSFVFYATRAPAWFSALYAALQHVFWSLGISWMIIAISCGHGPWVNGILSWEPLIVFSRLSYTVFLCHGITQLYSSGVTRQPNYASNFNNMHRSTADIVLGYLLAFFLTMIFESPIIGLEKALLWREKRKPNTVKEETLTEIQPPSTQAAA